MEKKPVAFPKKDKDDDILQLLLAHNEVALDLIRERYGRLLFNISKQIVTNNEDAEECVNDAYLKIWESNLSDIPSTLLIFICSVIKNVSLNKLRERYAQKRIPSEIIVSIDELGDAIHCSDSPDSEIMAEELKKLIDDFLYSLPKKKRYMFVAKYYLARSNNEIAETLGVSSSSVYKSLPKITEALKEYLKERGVYV